MPETNGSDPNQDQAPPTPSSDDSTSETSVTPSAASATDPGEVVSGPDSEATAEPAVDPTPAETAAVPEVAASAPTEESAATEEVVEGAPPPLAKTWDEFDMPATLRSAVDTLGWTTPTAVQCRSFPVMIQGTDVLVQSQTGSGKTGAFCLPWLANRFQAGPARETGVQLLVMLPTRELAKQVCDELMRLAMDSPVDVLPVYGGTAMSPQLDALKAGVHAVVGTPGRILDHIRRRSLDLSKIRTVVLDECDEMLSMGFLEDIRAILGACPDERQTCLFSATVPRDIQRIARRHMRDPVRLELSGDEIAAAEIDHAYYSTSGNIKTRDLVDVIMIEEPSAAIVFCNTREETRVVASVLQKHDYSAHALSSDLTQTAREKVMAKFRDRKLRFLVATDVAARGIDVSHVSHVINYSFPPNAEVYVHRTGRTGRAGRAGIALSLISPLEIGSFYTLTKSYKSILFRERKLPPSSVVTATRTERKLDSISRDFQHPVSPEWLLLARRLLQDPRGERVVAYLLNTAIDEAKRKARTEAEDGEEDNEDLDARDENRERGSRDRDSSRGRGGYGDRDSSRGRGPRDRDRDSRGPRDRDSRGPRDRDSRGSRDRDSRDRDRSRDRSRDSRGADRDRRPGRDEESSPRRRRHSAARAEESGQPVSAEVPQAVSAEVPQAVAAEVPQAVAAEVPQAIAAEPTGDAAAVNTGEAQDQAVSAEVPDASAVSAEPGESDASGVAADQDASEDGEPKKRRRRRRRRKPRGEGEGESSGESEAAPKVAAESEPGSQSPESGSEDDSEDGQPRRKRRRRRRRTKGEGEEDGTRAKASDEDKEARDKESRDRDSKDGPSGSRRRRRRRRGGSEAGSSSVPKESKPVEPNRVSQDEIVIDIDENELNAVRDEFGEIDEFDELTLKARRRAVLDELTEEVEVEDLTARDAAETARDDDDPEGEEDGDDDSSSAADSAEAPAVDASAELAPGASEQAVAAGNESAREATEDSAEPAESEEQGKKRRRRRRRKKTPAPPPELTCPPHKDFWEVWADKFTASDFEREEDNNDSIEEEIVVERPRERAPEPESNVALIQDVPGEDSLMRVNLNIGRRHGHKAAHVRALLRRLTGLHGKAVKDLTVRDKNSLFRIDGAHFETVAGHLAGNVVEEVSLLLVAVEGAGDPLRLPDDTVIAMPDASALAQAASVALSGTEAGDAVSAEGSAQTAEAAEVSAEVSAEASAEVSVEASAEASAEVSAEASAEVSAEASAEVSAEASAEVSAEASAEVSAEASAEVSAEASAEASAEVSAEASAEVSAEASAEVDGD